MPNISTKYEEKYGNVFFESNAGWHCGGGGRRSNPIASPPVGAYLPKINENQWKTIKINENQLKLVKTMKINENQWNQCISIKISEIQSKYIRQLHIQ